MGFSFVFVLRLGFHHSVACVILGVGLVLRAIVCNLLDYFLRASPRASARLA